MLKGLFLIKNEKNSSIEIFNALSQEFNSRYYGNDKLGVLNCKYYCNGVIKAINKCFITDTHSAKSCLNKLISYKRNDTPLNVSYIIKDVNDMVFDLKIIICTSIPINELPSCKELLKISGGNLLSAANDLVKNNIVNISVSSILLGKKLGESVKVKDIKEFYSNLLSKIKFEIGGELNNAKDDTTIFFINKCREEVEYCDKVMQKMRIDILKECITLGDSLVEERA